ncbi:MAG: hypothetical protein MUC32_11145 [Burkholderiaceae bacterium]|nr:hypothetical protein [Burkholderiaceae bacterium]
MGVREQGHKARRGAVVSASELAQLGYCERVAFFDWRDGPRRTPDELAAMARGDAAHDRFFRDGLEIARTSRTKGQCFVATLALGECEETRALRAFRDLVLRRSVAGRWCIGAYYRVSPALCRALVRRPRTLAAIRPGLAALGRAAATAVARRLER